ncbi:Mobile element protein [Chitinispirillum alkaliphilum]|nr:Mobile element protein [Chitinispirillum alkaliphilum]
MQYQSLFSEFFFFIRVAYGNVFNDINQVREELFEYTENYYNCQRLHSTLWYCSPIIR